MFSRIVRAKMVCISRNIVCSEIPMDLGIVLFHPSLLLQDFAVVNGKVEVTRITTERLSFMWVEVS